MRGYIATFFAFRHASKDQKVSIYAYKEKNGQSRLGRCGEPFIDQQGAYVETHSRHYKQQSTYTLCRVHEEENPVVYMRHEFENNTHPTGCKLKKYILDSSEKEEVLERLYRMNINDYTIFGDEESLMRMLAYKEFRRL